MENKKTYDVTIYSTPACPYCMMAKDYLTGRGIYFKDLDVASDMSAAKEMIEKSGQMGVPVIEIDGRIMVGFDPDAVDKLLNQKAAR